MLNSLRGARMSYVGMLLYGEAHARSVHDKYRVTINNTAFWQWFECFCSYVIHRFDRIPVILQRDIVPGQPKALNALETLRLRSFVDQVTLLKNHLISDESKWLHAQPGIWGGGLCYEPPTIPLLERIVRDVLAQMRSQWKAIRPTLCGEPIAVWDTLSWDAILMHVKQNMTELYVQEEGVHDLEYVREGGLIVVTRCSDDWLARLWQTSVEYIRVLEFPAHHLPSLKELLSVYKRACVDRDTRFLTQLKELPVLERVSEHVLRSRDKCIGTGVRAKGTSNAQLMELSRVLNEFLDSGRDAHELVARLHSAVDNEQDLDKVLDSVFESAATAVPRAMSKPKPGSFLGMTLIFFCLLLVVTGSGIIRGVFLVIGAAAVTCIIYFALTEWRSVRARACKWFSDLRMILSSGPTDTF